MRLSRYGRHLPRIALVGAVGLAASLFWVTVATSAPAVPRRPAPEPFRVESSAALAPNVSIPIRNVVAFDTAFTQRLNEVIRMPAAQRKGSWIFTTKATKDRFDRTLIYTSIDAQPQQLSTAELQALRDSINRRVDLAIQQEQRNLPGIASLGEGKITNDFFVGRILPESRRFPEERSPRTATPDFQPVQVPPSR